MRRKEQLVVGQFYHIYNKSIAGFRIFNNNAEFLRMRDMLRFYQIKDMPFKFSEFSELDNVKNSGFNKYFISISSKKEKFAQIIAYCFMPTHLHLILKQLKENGISIFVGNVLNSYARYFNTKYKRKGPLWEGRFKNLLLENDEYLQHLSRYIHLNPVTAMLTDKPEDWPYSSYNEYIGKIGDDTICEYENVLDISPNSYKKFVDDRISYQRELQRIKHLIADSASGF